MVPVGDAPATLGWRVQRQALGARSLSGAHPLRAERVLENVCLLGLAAGTLVERIPPRWARGGQSGTRRPQQHGGGVGSLVRHAGSGGEGGLGQLATSATGGAASGGQGHQAPSSGATALDVNGNKANENRRR